MSKTHKSAEHRSSPPKHIVQKPGQSFHVPVLRPNDVRRLNHLRRFLQAPLLRPESPIAKPATPFLVTLDKREADIPLGHILHRLGIDHEWITTSTGISAGMGDGAGVPQSDPPFIHTFVVNHSGESPMSTVTYRDVDKAALMTYLKVGTPTGRWAPGINDCNSWAEGAIRNSRPHDIYVSGPMTREGAPGPPRRIYQHVVVYADGSVHQR